MSTLCFCEVVHVVFVQNSQKLHQLWCKYQGGGMKVWGCWVKAAHNIKMLDIDGLLTSWWPVRNNNTIFWSQNSIQFRFIYKAHLKRNKLLYNKTMRKNKVKAVDITSQYYPIHSKSKYRKVKVRRKTLRTLEGLT